MSTENKTYKVIEFKKYKGEKRFCVADIKTGEILDDAQGYGYKTPTKAHAAYGYKNNPNRKKIDAQASSDRAVFRKWSKEKKNKEFISFCEQIAFEILKGSWGPDDVFDAKLVGEMAKRSEIELPLPPAKFLKYLWD